MLCGSVATGQELPGPGAESLLVSNLPVCAASRGDEDTLVNEVLGLKAHVRTHAHTRGPDGGLRLKVGGVLTSIAAVG